MKRFEIFACEKGGNYNGHKFYFWFVSLDAVFDAAKNYAKQQAKRVY